MGIKYYKLNTEFYEPFWTIDRTIVPYDHIETIVSGIEEYTGYNAWIECTNVEWTDIATISATGSLEELPEYVKVVTNDATYYYYLVDRTSVTAIKNNKVYYKGVYQLDDYMTVFCHKLGLCIDSNPYVLANRCFDNRWYTMTFGEEYTIDFIKQRYLSNTLPEFNTLSVRKLAYDTNESTLWSLNFPSTTYPESQTFTLWGGSDTITINMTALATTNSRGRYEYIVCKPTSIMNCSNNTLRSCDTKQQFIIIPLVSGYQEQILHALNDFDITGTHTQVLNPFGDNQIGLYECDVPFTILVGYLKNGLYGVNAHYIKQPMNSEGTTTLDVPFFTVNNNAPMVFKIIDYTQYTNGMYGKFLTFINNITLWTPDTEPALWNPTYYKEVYNNGNSNLVSDASRFIFKWNKDAVTEMGMQCYLCFSDNLNIAYNYGDLTNTALATLDNTESVDGNLSLSNMYFGSASAQYFAQNATTTATNIQVRQSEEKQAWIDATLNSAKDINNAVKPSSHILPWRAAADYTQRGINTALSVARTMVDTVMSQDRANKQFRSQINNLASSPSPMISNASTKASIPNKNGLFATWGIELHDNDKKVVFNDYLNNGYVANEVKPLKDIFNRQLMNILNIDTRYNDAILKRILRNDTEEYFNTPYWNQQFLAWMNESHKIYNTWWLINCTDYSSDNYHNNIENELPVIPVTKSHIKTIITSLRTIYPRNEIETLLKEDNPNAPEGFWDEITIQDISFNHFSIKAKPTSQNYYGTMLVSSINYNGYILDGEKKHYFDDVKFLENHYFKDEWTFTCPDGTVYKGEEFNKEIIFNDTVSFDFLPRGFLAHAHSFNHPITINSSAETFTINAGIFNSCKIFSSNLFINAKNIVINGAIFNRVNNYTATITINYSNSFTINDNEPWYALSAAFEKSPAYATGITIAGNARETIMNKYPNGFIMRTGDWRKLI